MARRSSVGPRPSPSLSPRRCWGSPAAPPRPRTWYADADGDGFTDAGTSLAACDAPAGYAAATEDDCDDADATSFPGGDDLPGDGIDQDCDGADTIGEDTDVPDADTGDGNVDEEPGGCGCRTGGDIGLGWLAALVGLLAARRRRADGKAA